MVEEKHQNDTKVLVGVLAFLVAAAVALVVAIVLLPMMNRMNHSVADELSDDNMAKECLHGNVEDQIGCINDKAFSYYDDGDCEDAMKVYDDVPAEMFKDEELVRIYDEAHSTSLACARKSVQDYWLNKYEDVLSRTEGRD